MVTRGRTVLSRWASKTAVLAVVVVVPLALAGCTPPRAYVALGDSYSAGPLIPVQQNNPAGCLRSDHNYPHDVQARRAFPAFRDNSCSGAVTADMTSSQTVSPGPNPPPQFNALDSGTVAVSLTIGGNDVGFTSIIENCSSPTNMGTPCQDRYVVNGHDEISAKISATAPKVAAVLQGIHGRSPNATIYLLSYLDIMPDNGTSCYPQMPITAGDAPYLRNKEVELNTMLKTAAAANAATYVDTYTPSIGHDACKLPTVRWVEPIASINAAPVHPNSVGMQAVADILQGKGL